MKEHLMAAKKTKTGQGPIKLDLQEIGWSVDSQTILSGVTVTIHPGEIVGLIGPNGSGKSTLLRCIYRYLEPDYGTILLDNTDLQTMTLQDSARKTAAVLQESANEFKIKVFEVVLMGRSPHKELLQRDSQEDYALALEALEKVEMLEYADRHFHTLSGGEKQRVLLARAICQQARLLVLDEPTNHLDIRYQMEIMELIQELSVSTIVALHDLNLASSYCHRVVVLNQGTVVSHGVPKDVLSVELIRDVYGVDTKIGIQPETGKVAVTYLPLNHRS